MQRIWLDLGVVRKQALHLVGEIEQTLPVAANT